MNARTAWTGMILNHLPKGYNLMRAHVVDSAQRISDEFDIVVFDDSDGLPKLTFHGLPVIPVEYTRFVFDLCEMVDVEAILTFGKKIAKLRRLIDLDAKDIPYGGIDGRGQFNLVESGILAVNADTGSIIAGMSRYTDTFYDEVQPIDLGCVASSGIIKYARSSGITLDMREDPLTDYLQDLFAKIGKTVNGRVFHLRAYGSWLEMS